MAVVIAVLTCVSVIAVLDLLLVLGLTRRLRLGQISTERERTVTPTPGTEVPVFEYVDLDGLHVTNEIVRAHGAALVSFIGEKCSACERLIRDLGNTSLEIPLYVFASGSENSPEFQEKLRKLHTVGTVVFLGEDIRLREDFDINMVPTIIRVANGVVVSASFRLRDVFSQPSPTSRRAPVPASA